MLLKIDPHLSSRFPELRALVAFVHGVSVQRESTELEAFKQSVFEELRVKYTLDSIKNQPIFRAYRDFYWRIGIDPTKTRPAGEALLRRIVAGKNFPKINTLVDAYNMTSAKTGVAIGAFDYSKIRGSLLLRNANPGEKFLGIGMNKPETLGGNEPVVSDDEKLIAIYPYRDSEETKITLDTKEVLLLICGVPGIGEEKLREAATLTVEFISKFCHGRGEIP